MFDKVFKIKREIMVGLEMNMWNVDPKGGGWGGGGVGRNQLLSNMLGSSGAYRIAQGRAIGDK
jgi:hypothetical protein